MAAPDSPTGSLVIDGGQIDFKVALPYSEQLSTATLVDGDIVYSGSGDAPSIVVDALASSVRILAVLESSQSRHNIPFSLDLPDDAFLQIESNGSVHVGLSLDGVTVLIKALETPWAVDASGRVMPTHYAVSGSTVTQVVNPGPEAEYPITADPQTCTSSCYPFKSGSTERKRNLSH